jgi:hypothetical protein
MAVYILHFSKPLAHAQHYVGYSETPESRLHRHIKRMEQPLLRAALQAGIKLTIARIYPDADRKFERQLKNRHKTADYCPLCNPERVYRELTKQSK